MHICIYVCMYNVYMYVCMYGWMVDCMRCGGVWHALCVLYGRWQGRLHYPTVRVGFLTLVVAWRSIPLSKRRVTVLAWPSRAASCRALHPVYNRDTQTHRQTQVSNTGTHRQTAHAKGPSHYSSIIRQENRHIYMYVFMVECMRMTCTVCTVWQVAGSFALSYCKGRVPYLGSGMKIYSSV